MFTNPSRSRSFGSKSWAKAGRRSKSKSAPLRGEQLEVRQVLTAAIDVVSPGEFAGMQKLYAVDNNAFLFNAPYTVNNSVSIPTGSFNRVAYFVELGGNWVWTSMDAFKTNPLQVGVPKWGSGIVEGGTVVKSLNVEASNGLVTAPGPGSKVTPGTGLTGIIEFWPSNYNQNGGGLFGSNNSKFDWKDGGFGTSNGHGSFQVHAFNNPGMTSANTIFGITHNGGSGLGDQIPNGSSGSQDWTFGPNATSYGIRNMEVWVGTTVYVDDAWAGFTAGQAIVDADPVLAGDQPGVFGTNAFATSTTALAAPVVGAGSLIVVNAGNYSTEAVNINKSVTMRLQNDGADTSVIFGSLDDTVTNASVILDGITLTTGGNNGSTTFDSVISGTGDITKMGTGTMTLGGTNTFAGNVIVSAGTVNLTNPSGLGSTAGNTTVAGNANLNFSLTGSQTVPENLIFNADVNGRATINATTAAGQVTTLSGNIQANSISTQLVQWFSNGGGTIRYTGDITGNLNGSELVTRGTSSHEILGSVTLSGAADRFGITDGATVRLGAAGKTYSWGGATGISFGTLITNVNNVLPAGTALRLGQNSPTSPPGNLNLNGTNQTVGSVTVESNIATPNVITITPGNTLTVTGNFTVGIFPLTNSKTTNLTATGGGTLALTGAGATVEIGLRNNDQNQPENKYTVDFSGLGNFTANVTNFRVGHDSRARTDFFLSNTANTIIANILTVGNSLGNNAGLVNMTLGTGSNVFHVNTFDMGRGKSNTTVKFASQAAGSPGTFTLRGQAGGTSVTTFLNIGVATEAGTTAHIQGLLDLRGHLVDAAVGTLNLGHRTTTSTNVTGTLWFDTGSFTANSVALARITNGTVATGNLNVDGGTFTVGGGSFSLAQETNANTTTAGNGNLNVTGGEVVSNVNIIEQGVTTTSTINIAGGTLNLAGNNIGTLAIPIDNFNFTSGRLKDVNILNRALTQQGGALQLGANGAADTMTIVGDYNLQAAGSLEIDLNGTAGAGAVGGHDQLIVNGAVSLAGDLEVSVNYTPASPNSFTILTATSLTGEFNGLADGAKVLLGNQPFIIDYTGTAVTLTFDAAPVITGTGGGDSFFTRVVGSDIEVYQGTDATGPLLLKTAQANLTSLLLDGGAGDDTLVVDPTNPITVPFTFEGGADADSIVIQGGAITTATFDYTDATSGSITLDGSVINYTGLEPILMNTGTITNAIFNLPTATLNRATLTDSGTSLTLNAPTFELTTISEPTGSLTINGGTGGDSITTVGAVSIPSSLTVNVADFYLGGNLSTNGNAMLFGSDVVLLGNSAIDTTGGGATAAGANITFNGGVLGIDAANNNLDLNAGTGGNVVFAQGITAGYTAVADSVIGEAELFSSRAIVSPQGDGWFVVPSEDPGADTLNGARGKYVQALPDSAGGGGGPSVAPSIDYKMQINTPGSYRLSVRWANNDNVGNGGNSDSMYADIVEIKDGAGGLPDWYELGQNTTTFTWDAGGEFEANNGGPLNNAMLFNIPTAGIYTLRFSQREDGSAVDAFAFQAAALGAITGTGVGPATTPALLDVVIANANNVTSNDLINAASFTQNVVQGATQLNDDVTVTGAFDVLKAGVTVNGDLTADTSRVGIANASGANATLTVTGGAVVIGNGDGDFIIGQRTVGSTTATLGTVNFGGATSVTINVDNVLMGDLNDGAANITGAVSGSLTLSAAGANTVTADLFRIGESEQQGNTTVTSSVVLGGGTNSLNLDTFIVGGTKSIGSVTIAAGGSVQLNGVAGAASRGDLFIGRGDSDTGFNTRGTVDLTGATSFTALLNELTLGERLVGGSGTGTVRGDLILGASNMVDATLVRVSRSAMFINQPLSTLTLGALNSFNVDTFEVATRRANGLVNFAAPGSVFNLSGSSGAATNLTIGDTAGDETGNLNSGIVSLNGGTFNATLGTVLIALRDKRDGQSPATTGTLSYNAGTVTAGVVTLAQGEMPNATDDGRGIGTLNIGGSATFAPTAINFATGTSTGSVGTLNQTGATSVVDLGGGNIDNGVGTAVYNLTAGTLKNVNTFGFDLDQMGGTLQIGADGAVDTMTFNANYDLSAGTLALDLDGTAGAGVAGGHDQLLVNGTVTLAGTLLLDYGTTFPSGTQFTIIENDMADLVTGTFASLPEGTIFTQGVVNAQISYQGGTGNDVVLTIIDLDNPVLNGTPGGDDFIVRRDSGAGTTVEVLQDNVVIFTRSLATVQSIAINGLAGNDTLTMDYGNGGYFTMPAGVTFNGGADSDTLFSSGGTFTTVNHNLTGAAAGNLVVDNGTDPTLTVSYTTAESVDITGDAIANLALNLSAGADAATLADSGANTLFSAPTVVGTLFAAPTATLNITGDAADSVAVSGDVDLGGANINLGTSLASVDFNAGGSVTTTGNVSIDAAAVTSADAGVDVIASDLTVTAATGIDLDTTVANITATTSGTGDININETDGATLVNIDASAGNATVTSATGNLAVTTVSASGNVVLTATAGAITDTNAAANNVTAADLNATAATGIDLDTTIATLTASGTGAGAITIDDLNALEITSVTNTGGAITIGAGGTLTNAGTVNASGAATLNAGSDLTLNVGSTSTAGGVLTLNGGAGGVTMSIFGTVSGSSVAVNGGAGGDTIVIDSNGGTASDGGTVENILAPLTVNGGGGTDTLTLDDSGDAAVDAGIIINSTSVQGLVEDNGAPTITLASVETLVVELGDGGNTVNLDAVNGGALTSVTVNGGTGDDTFDVTPGFTTIININADAPGMGAVPGDTLNFDLTAIDKPIVFPATSDGLFNGLVGAMTTATINWTSIESFTINGETVTVGELFVEATPGDDRIIFRERLGGVQVQVGMLFFPLNGSAYPIVPNMKLLAYGRDGNDEIVVGGALNLPVLFDGGMGNDYLAGGINNDTLIGGEGNDRMLGSEGNNFLDGGLGNDFMDARSGNDVMFGGDGDGNDELNGGAGDDILDGGEGNDILFGHLGSDLIVGRGGMDTVNGYGGNDVILGGDADDTLIGGVENDLILGGLGSDRILGDGGSDDLVGGTSELDADIIAALNAMMATLGSSLADADTANGTNVRDAIDDWFTTGSDRSGFGLFTDDTTIDDLTGGIDGSMPTPVNQFHTEVDDRYRDFRDGTDMMFM